MPLMGWGAYDTCCAGSCNGGIILAVRTTDCAICHNIEEPPTPLMGWGAYGTCSAGSCNGSIILACCAVNQTRFRLMDSTSDSVAVGCSNHVGDDPPTTDFEICFEFDIIRSKSPSKIRREGPWQHRGGRRNFLRAGPLVECNHHCFHKMLHDVAQKL